MIDINKKYRTRDGREVRIYSTDTGHGFDQVHGATKQVHGWELTSWGYNGMKDVSGVRESLGDLIEVKPRIKQTIWVNVYPESVSLKIMSVSWPSKERADNQAMSNRIACVKVEIDCEEGEGL